MQPVCRGSILVHLILNGLLVQDVVVDDYALVFVRREIRRDEEVDVVLDQKLAGVALWVLEVDIQPKLVRQTDVLRIHRLPAALERLGQIQGHAEAMRLIKELVCLFHAAWNHARRVLWHVVLGYSDLDVRLVADAPSSVLCKQLPSLYELHPDGRNLDAFSERYQDKVGGDVGADDVILLGNGDLVGELVRPNVLVNLLHGHGFEHVAPECSDDADVRGRRELLAHVTSVHRGLEVVHDPVRRQALDALVEVAGHLEGKVPLMVPGIDLVRLVLVGDFDGEQRQVVDEKVCLLGNGLRAHGVGQMPSA